MHLPLGQFAPEVKLGLVSASRNCFPRELSQDRMDKLRAACHGQGLVCFVPDGDCKVIETKEHARKAAQQIAAANCDAAILFLGNFFAGTRRRDICAQPVLPRDDYRGGRRIRRDAHDETWRRALRPAFCCYGREKTGRSSARIHS